MSDRTGEPGEEVLRSPELAEGRLRNLTLKSLPAQAGGRSRLQVSLASDIIVI